MKKQITYTDGGIENEGDVVRKAPPHNPTPAHPSTQKVKVEEQINLPLPDVKPYKPVEPQPQKSTVVVPALPAPELKQVGVLEPGDDDESEYYDEDEEDSNANQQQVEQEEVEDDQIIIEKIKIINNSVQETFINMPTD